jgi:hypothetical protein
MNLSRLSLLMLLLTFLSFGQTTGQKTNSSASKTVLYSFVFNHLPDGVNFPLIGFLNFAEGSHSGAHIGFFNSNQRDFSGLQLGFVNVAGGNVSGSQTGFVNVTAGSFNGLKLGFINPVGGSSRGAMLGFVNATGQKVNGLQMGFVNVTGGNTQGFQTAFVNINGGTLQGFQLGFVNAASVLKGFQLGFINFADSLGKGLPFGFLSFIKKGGYSALELSVTESFPFNLTYKTGIKGLYTSLIGSWNPNGRETYAFGMGLGSNIPLSTSVWFNPELTAQTTYPNGKEIYGLTAQLGFAVTPRFVISLGPSLIWLSRDKEEDFFDPLFSFYDYRINDKNWILAGVRFALRYNLRK